MPKISTYNSDTSPTTSDYVLGNQASGPTTKRFRFSDLITLFFNNIPANTSLSTGWNALLGYTPDTTVYNGNHSYTLTFNGVDLTSTLSPGMRIKTTRNLTAPINCTSLNGSTQYYSKASPAGFSYTDTYSVMAWVKLAGYNGADNYIFSKYSSNGSLVRINSSGQVIIYGEGTGATRTTTSYQSVPLNKWVHIAATLQMSTGTGHIYIDGIDVPVTTTGAGTAIVQAGNLNIGALSSGPSGYFNGKLAQVAIFSAALSQATIQSYMNQGLAGVETSIISAYSFNSSINDLNIANANNLTANGSAVATNTDSPFGGQASGLIDQYTDYGIVTKATFSINTTLTVQCPEGSTIPTSGGVSAVSYATVKAPYGMPVQKGKWRVVTDVIVDSGNVTVAGTTPTNINGMQLSVPVGEWELGAQYVVGQEATVGGNLVGRTWLNSTVTPSLANALAMVRNGSGGASETEVHLTFTRSVPVSLSSATVYTCVFYFETGSGTGSYRLFGTSIADTPLLYADNAYL